LTVGAIFVDVERQPVAEVPVAVVVEGGDVEDEHLVGEAGVAELHVGGRHLVEHAVALGRHQLLHELTQLAEIILQLLLLLVQREAKLHPITILLLLMLLLISRFVCNRSGLVDRIGFTLWIYFIVCDIFVFVFNVLLILIMLFVIYT